MKAVYEVLVQEFYRRNFLFFFLCIALLGFVFRPPTLLISPIFIGPMLEDLIFFGVICGLMSLYYVKCVWESYKRIHIPENRFLYSLGAMEKGPLYLLIGKSLAAVMAPGIGYMLVIVGYSIKAGTWHALAILGAHALILLAATYFLIHGIYHPKENELSSGIQKYLEGRIKESLSFIQLQMIWFRKRRQVIILKGICLVLLALTAWSEASDPFPPKGLDLIFLCIVSLQCVYAYQLRRAEDESIFILRNLPINRFRRYLSYLITGLVIFLPEVMLWISWIPTEQSIWQALSYYALGMAVWMIGIALLYYQAMEMPDYLQWVFGMFMTLFVMILVGVSGIPAGALTLLFSSWIFFEEYYKWNGFKKV